MDLDDKDQSLLDPFNNSDQLDDKSSSNANLNKASGTDFVKKLFQMLDENAYDNIVRWSDSGDSFIITDTNEFTKEILPRHFKHSNFASFVRQLNKYDFHKVKISNDLKLRYQIENIWEFKHPDFQRDNKESLDNIKRKVPVKKDGEISSTPTTFVSINQFRNLQDSVDFMEKKNQSLSETVEKLQEDLASVSSKYNTMVSSLLTTRSINESYSRSIQILAKCITSLGVRVPSLDLPFGDASNGNNDNKQGLVPPLIQQSQNPPPISVTTTTSTTATTTPTKPTSNPLLNEPARPSVSASIKTGILHHSKNNSQESTATTTSGSPQFLTTTPPVPVTGLPSQQYHLLPGERAPIVTPQQQEMRILQRPTGTALHVLLVEDDEVCIQLCRKFLMKYGCTVEVVTDGLAAISVLEKVKFDLVLMDIVMPNLDGASATSVIRSFDKDTPIIAMTGNYQRQDLVTYLNHGMTDILAKPFTKDDLYLILEKHQMNKKLIYPLNDPYNPDNKLGVNSDRGGAATNSVGATPRQPADLVVAGSSLAELLDASVDVKEEESEFEPVSSLKRQRLA